MNQENQLNFLFYWQWQAIDMWDGVKWFLKWTLASFITVLCISVALVLLYLLVFRGHLIETVPKGQAPEVEYKDFVVIILTALSVMIALGGALVAFITIFGYVEAKRFIERKVERFVMDDLEPL